MRGKGRIALLTPWLSSFSYIHFGAPKQWYVVPPANASRFERFAASKSYK